jgi:hypothetical protein
VARAAAEDVLAAQITAVHAASGGTYGSPRVTAELRDQGVRVNRKRVERIMRQRAVVGRHLRRGKRTTIPDPAAPAVADLLGRDFTATAPDQRWCGDITYLRVGDRFLYLATVIDIATRRLIGWSLNTHMRTDLVINALDAAVAARGGRVHGVMCSTATAAPSTAAPVSPAPATATAYAAPGAASAHRSTTPSRRRSSPPSNANSPSTIDAGTARPTPDATSSAGSPSTTTAVATPPSATAAPPSTNEPSTPLRCYRSRHNPVSTPPGEAQLCHPHSVNVDTPPGRQAEQRVNQHRERLWSGH